MSKYWLRRFSVRKIPQYLSFIARSENSKKAYVIEVAGFSDGDVNHIAAYLKAHGSINVHNFAVYFHRCNCQILCWKLQ